jgi:hypothetical protein|tara:strand:+ start:920 stop:1240 length:321 start_codon:yes stop_codon:yes gene_type:complete
MTGIIEIANIGNDAGNFLLYSDVDNYLSAFESNVSRQSLLDGFPSDNIPNGTTIIRALSNTEKCSLHIDITVVTTTTTSTTTNFPWLLLQTGDPIEQQNTNLIKLQ